MVDALIIDGWSVRRVAERFQVEPAAVSKWVNRFRTGETVDVISAGDLAPFDADTPLYLLGNEHVECL